jgi:Transcription factor WhiB
MAANAPAEVRRRHRAMVLQAQAVCGACPVVASCLFQAVVEHDVSGYVGATTPRQRTEIRRRLGVTVEPEDLDTLAGVTGRHRQIDHDEVVRLRHANPQESLETLAHRLGCSLSTVKRHLRRERGRPSPSAAAPTRPTMDQVLAVTAEVVGGAVRREVAA